MALRAGCVSQCRKSLAGGATKGGADGRGENDGEKDGAEVGGLKEYFMGNQKGALQNAPCGNSS